MRRSSPRSQVHEPADACPRECLRVLAGVEAPERRAGRGVEREDAKLGRGRVEDAVRHHRLALHLGSLEGILGVVRPCDLERADICRSDLRQGRVAGLLGAAAVVRPVGPGSRQRGDQCEE